MPRTESQVRHNRLFEFPVIFPVYPDYQGNHQAAVHPLEDDASIPGREDMKRARRRFLRFAAAAAALPAISRFALAQAYPARPVRLMVGYAAGAAPDIVARLVGQWLTERLGRQFLIEDRPGAAGNLAAETVVRAAPDGHTLLYCTTANTINVALYDKLNFVFTRDIAPVAGVVRVPNLISVSPSLPIHTIAELVAYAKLNPGKLNYGASSGGAVFLTGALFKMMAGVNIVHVPYSNQMQAVTDLLADQMQVSFDAMPTTIEFARAGKLRPLAVTTAARSPALPDVPTVAEAVPGYEASSWHGVGAPSRTPAAIVEKLNHEINAGLIDLKMAARMADLGGVPMVMTPGEFGRFVAEETEKWGKVVRFAGAKAE
jgi:tripartite-type tricarboxylate transporter receptor subunit TctC